MGFCQFNNTPSTDVDPGIFICKPVSTDPSANSQTSVANPSKKGKKHNCIHSKDTRKAYTTSLVCLSNTGLQGQPGSVAKPADPLGRSVQRLQAGWWMQKQHISRIRDLPSKLHCTQVPGPISSVKTQNGWNEQLWVGQNNMSHQGTEFTAGHPGAALPLIVLYQLLDTAGNALLCLFQLLQQFQTLLLQMALVLCQTLLQPHLILGQSRKKKQRRMWSV